MIRSCILLTVLFVLSACGGSSGPVVQDVVIRDGDVSAPPDNGIPKSPEEEFDDRFGTDGTDEDSDLGPALEEALDTIGQPADTLIRVEFTREPALGDSRVAVANGIRAADGTAIRVGSDIPGTFAHTFAYVIDNTGALGVIGSPTVASVIPSGGTASFSGGAVGVLVLPDSGFDLRNGQSDVAVNFGAATVRVELGGFESISNVSGNLSDAPFDTIVLTDARISGSALTGGTLSLGGGQTLAQVLGDNRRTLARGQFYGVDADNDSPAEVGGVIFAEGENGFLFGSYIAK